jgi:hypothetical protein
MKNSFLSISKILCFGYFGNFIIEIPMPNTIIYFYHYNMFYKLYLRWLRRLIKGVAYIEIEYQISESHHLI